MKTRDKLLIYFKNQKGVLDILDGKTSDDTYNGENHYNAVSVYYLHKYLLKEKVSLKFVAKTLYKLCQEKYILPIPCDFAGNLVFCNYNYSLNKFFVKFKVADKEKKVYSNNSYHKDIEHIDKFNKLIN